MEGRGRARQGRSGLSEPAKSPSEEAFQRGDWAEGARLATTPEERARYRNDPVVAVLFALATALLLFLVVKYY